MRRFFSLFSLRARLILLVLLTVVPALALFLYTAHERRQVSAAAAQESLLELAGNASNDYRLLIENTRQLLMVLARLPAVLQHNPAACSAIMVDLAKAHPHYLALGAVNLNGNPFCGNNPLTQPINVADRPWFQRVLRTRDFTVGNYQIGRVIRQATLPFAHPALDDAGKLQAVVVASVGLNWLKQMGSRAQLPPGSTLTLFDRNRVILGRHPGGDEWVGKPVSDPILIQALQERSEGVAAGRGADGVPRFIGFTSLRGDAEAGVVLAISIPQKTVFAEADRILNRNLFWLGIVSLIALAAAWFGSNLFILRPLNSLLSASKKLRNGDVNARTGLSRGTGELARLAHTFDEMAEALQRRQIEARQAEEALRESEEKFRALAETAIDAIVSANSQGNVIYFNKAAERIFGYPAKDVIGKPLTHLMPERFHDAHRKGLKRFLSTGEAHVIGKAVELAGRRKDGTEFPLELSLAAWRTDDATFFTGILRDITERKRAETVLGELSGRLIRIQDEERRRIARELHDSTSPLLTALTARLYNARYRAGDLDATTARVIDESLKFAEDTSNVIRTVSYLLHPPLLDESGLLASLRWYLTGFADRTGIRVVMDFPEELARLPRDAEIALFRIVQESLANVFRPSGSRLVTVRLTLDQGYLRLEMGDQGRGIPSDVLERVKTGTGELGIGIAGMRERMRQLGGRLEVTSSSSGTLVTAILPTAL